VLDEPTAVLTPQEINKLFRIMRNMKEQGCAIVIITHKLNEVMEISDLPFSSSSTETNKLKCPSK
jgi:simple sugar transport system ATP-binding protein